MDCEYHNKITGVPNADVITNGAPCEIQQLKNVNAVGSIVDKHQNYLSDINALFMIINQSAKNGQEKLNALLRAGANPDLSISWHGTPTTAREFLVFTGRKFTINN